MSKFLKQCLLATYNQRPSVCTLETWLGIRRAPPKNTVYLCWHPSCQGCCASRQHQTHIKNMFHVVSNVTNTPLLHYKPLIATNMNFSSIANFLKIYI
jgi:hypothetical protein